MANPNVSDLRHRIKFQSLSRVSDSQGGYQESWADFYECWAQITPKNGNERRFADRIEDFYDHEIKIRWADNLKTEMQIVFGTRIFQIKAIMRTDERRFFMVIKAQEKAGT